MKFIHTSDWHLGQEFYSYDRMEEHVSFLSQLKDIVESEQPDLLVISGDIYHNATPSNTVMRLFTDYLDLIRCACPSMTTVIIAGNHDSSSRLEVNRTLWNHLGVHVIGKIEKNDECVDWNRHIIPINAKEGATCCYVVALPFVQPQSFPPVKENLPRECRQASFLKELADRVATVNTENVPVVMLAHMAIEGSDITGHERTQGGLDYTSVSDLQVDFDYLALGHIHCPQTLMSGTSQPCCARYCGSPIPVNFDEQYVHSVSIVEINHKNESPLIRTIPISNPWPLKTLPSAAVPFDTALKQLESFPDDQQAYIRLHVQLTDVPPQNAMERANQAVINKKARFCCFKWEKQGNLSKEKKTFTDVDQIKARSPLDIAELYYESQFGQPLDMKLKDMLSKVIQEVQQDIISE